MCISTIQSTSNDVYWIKKEEEKTSTQIGEYGAGWTLESSRYLSRYLKKDIIY